MKLIFLTGLLIAISPAFVSGQTHNGTDIDVGSAHVNPMPWGLLLMICGLILAAGAAIFFFCLKFRGKSAGYSLSSVNGGGRESAREQALEMKQFHPSRNNKAARQGLRDQGGYELGSNQIEDDEENEDGEDEVGRLGGRSNSLSLQDIDMEREETFDDALNSEEKVDDDIDVLIDSEGGETGPAFSAWGKENIALYGNYAALGLCDGLISGTLLPFCYNSWEDQPNNTCAMARSVVSFAWGIKLFHAFVSESFRPFGLRRKPYIVGGWVAGLLVLLVIAIFADSLSFYQYVFFCAAFDFCIMFADVNADGYTVELSRLESPKQRGRILADGQLCRFTMSGFAGLVQSFLLNGPSTNPPGEGFEWGLTVSQMYWMLFFICAPSLGVSFYFFRERQPGGGEHSDRGRANDSERSDRKREDDEDDASSPETSPKSSRSYHDENVTMRKLFGMVWEVMHNVTVLMIMLWSIGFQVLACAPNKVGTIMQGSVIRLSQLQWGIDNIVSYLLLTIGVWIFKSYLRDVNWRWTQLMTTALIAGLNMLWFVPILTDFRNGWFTLMIDGTESLAQGFTQVLISMAVIEIAPVNLEATSYELIISVSNSFIALSSLVWTQLMNPFALADISEENDDSSADTRMAQYTLLISTANIFGALTFIWLFPASKEECAKWKRKGGRSTAAAYGTAIFTFVCITYTLTFSVLNMIPTTACLEIVGGDGC